MEKYGVETPHEKTAEEFDIEGRTCPQCGREVHVHGSVLVCPVHGTKPFEHKE